MKGNIMEDELREGEDTSAGLDDVIIYSNGIVYCSVCAIASLSDEEVTREVNMLNPSGVGKWQISEQSFGDGKPNPCICDEDANRKHYLFNC